MTPRQKAWLLPPAAVAVTAGVLLGRLTASLWPGAAALLLALAAAGLLRGRFRLSALLAVFLSLGCLSASYAFHPALPPEGPVRVSGVLSEPVQPGSARQWRTVLVSVSLDGVPFPSGAYWTFYAEDTDLPPDLLPGMQVSFDASLYHPSGRVNPDGYDFRETLLRRGVTVGVYGNAELAVSAPDRFPLLGAAASLRHRLSSRLVSLLGQEAGGYASALLFGFRSLIPSEDRAAFARLGIAHVLSVSGFHVGVLLGMVSLLFRLLGVPPRLRLWLSAGVLLLYCALCGLSQPVLRASALSLLTLEGKILNRPRSGLHLLSAVYIALLLLSPPQLTGASFQLTFGAVLGIVLVTPYLQRLCPFRSSLPRYVWNASAVFTGAQIGLLYPELSFFQSLPLLSFALNLPVSLLSSALILLDWLVLGLSFLPGPVSLAVVPAVWVNGVLVRLVRALASVPGTALWTRAPSLMAVPGIALLLLALSCLFHFSRRTRLSLVGAGLAAVALSLIPLPHTSTEYIQLSAGNEDAALLWDQDRAIVLDAGDVSSPLSSFLRRRRLIPDAVILTHLHSDHVAGLASLLDEGIPVPLVYLPWGAKEALVDPSALALLDRLAASGTQFRLLSRGDTIALPSGAVSILWPEAGKVRPRQDANESSLAALITLQGVTMLHTGDLDGRYEMYAALPADLLRVAHHGSLSSTGPDFLAAVSPQAALVSCAWEDRHQSVQERLGDVPVWSTAVGGALTVVFRDHDFRIIPYITPTPEEE